MGYIYEIQYCAEQLMDGTGGTGGTGRTGGTENCVEGHHGTSLDVPYILWGLRDGMDRWDIELC